MSGLQAVAVPARIQADNAVQVLAELRAAARSTPADPATPLALDLASLREFDSAALSLLLQLARDRAGSGSGAARSLAGSRNGGESRQDPELPLLLLNPPAKLRELADLYGVAQMLFAAAAAGDGPANANRLGETAMGT